MPINFNTEGNEKTYIINISHLCSLLFHYCYKYLPFLIEIAPRRFISFIDIDKRKNSREFNFEQILKARIFLTFMKLYYYVNYFCV